MEIAHFHVVVGNSEQQKQVLKPASSFARSGCRGEHTLGKFRRKQSLYVQVQATSQYGTLAVQVHVLCCEASTDPEFRVIAQLIGMYVSLLMILSVSGASVRHTMCSCVLKFMWHKSFMSH